MAWVELGMRHNFVCQSESSFLKTEIWQNIIIPLFEFLAFNLHFWVLSNAVATPKQIRELMQVDGLTNDEVKSHLQVSYWKILVGMSYEASILWFTTLHV